MLSDEILIIGVCIAACVALHYRCEYLIRKCNRKIEYLHEEQRRYWREHKDDYWETRGKHEKLMDCLNIKEVPAERSKYVAGDTK